jgi:FKBP-type peptidyl-prolyl cis-trans isomerase
MTLKTSKISKTSNVSKIPKSANTKASKLKYFIIVLLVLSISIVLYKQKKFSVTEILSKNLPNTGVRSDKLQIVDAREGLGVSAQNGDIVEIDYEAFVYNPNHKPQQEKAKGQKFDSTVDRHEPVKFTLGNGQVVPGLEQAVIGMKAGGRRYAVVPSHLGYGKTGAGDGLVPANESLLYIIQLHALNP